MIVSGVSSLRVLPIVAEVIGKPRGIFFAAWRVDREYVRLVADDPRVVRCRAAGEPGDLESCGLHHLVHFHPSKGTGATQADARRIHAT